MTNGAAATFMEINESIHALTLITSYRKLPFALQLNPTDENDGQEQQYPICASHIGTNRIDSLIERTRQESEW